MPLIATPLARHRPIRYGTGSPSVIARDIFEDLFVLEMTNNHLGNLQRGLDIIRQHSRIVRFNNMRAAIKLQFRDLDNFIHRDFRSRPTCATSAASQRRGSPRTTIG